MTKKTPVVVVLGHIDHGKSTLIDYIRKTNLTEKEAGGITQSIGAYKVALGKDKAITFIDTPGHEAFENMRSHGAKAADIGILVVAADEGVKPQTVEAIKDIKAASLPFIVALNKADKREANPRKVREELIQYEVFVEGFGGNVPALEISAKTGKGVKELLDLIALMAEVEDVKADASVPAKGVVIVSSRDSKKGVVVTLIIKEGTLKQGQWIKLETTHGKIKAMSDFLGKQIKEALPSEPVQILGLEGLPEVGEMFRAVASLEEARRSELPIKEEITTHKLATGDKVLRFILKAKEKASLDALTKLFTQVQTQHPDIVFQVLSQGVGDISTSDIENAHQFDAFIIGFDIKIPSVLKSLLVQREVAVKLFTIIYDLPVIIGDIVAQKFVPQAEIAPKSEAVVLGVFSKSKDGQVVGGKVTAGAIKKGMTVQIKREGSVVGKGKITNLQHLKKDVSAVEAGKEFGILLSGDEVKIDDALLEM